MKGLKILLIGIFVTAVFSWAGAFAQSPGGWAELALFEEIPVVYSASKMEESILEAPAAISVITDKDLNQWGITDVPDSFRRVPGMDVIAVDGKTWGVSARGFAERWSRRMLVLVDGMSVYTPLFSGVSWDFLPLIVDDIKDIEIVRGPNDTLYGFNAFNGVINISTKSPKNTYGFFGKYIYGSYGKNQFIGRYGGNIDLENAGEIDYRISFSDNKDQGYGTKYGREYADKEHVDMAIARALYTYNEAFNVDFQYGINFGPRDIAPGATASTRATQHVGFEYELVKFNLAFSDTHKAHLQMYHWDVNRDVKRSPNGLDSDDYKENQWDIEFQDSFSLFDGKSHTVVGTNYRHNSVQSLLVKRNMDDNTCQQASDDLASAFLNQKFILVENIPFVKALTAVAGIRAEYSHLLRNMEWIPRASLLYEPVINQVFRATYARAARLPSFLEEYDTTIVPNNTGSIFRLLGNQDLKSEIVDSYELGWSGIFMNGRLEANLDTYIANYRGLVLASQTQAFNPILGRPQIIEFNSTSTARSVGLEFDGVVRPYKWLEIYTNYTYETIKDTRAGQPNAAIYAGGTPENKINAGLTAAFKKDSIENMEFLEGFTFNINANYKDSYIFFNENDNLRSEYDIKKHWRMDLRLGKTLFDEKVEIAFIGQNLIGDGNHEAGWVEVPQEFFFTVSLKGWPWEVLETKDKEQTEAK